MDDTIEGFLRQSSRYPDVLLTHIAFHADIAFSSSARSIVNKHRAEQRFPYSQLTKEVLPTRASNNIAGHLYLCYAGKILHQELLMIQEQDDGTMCIVPYSPPDLILPHML